MQYLIWLLIAGLAAWLVYKALLASAVQLVPAEHQGRSDRGFAFLSNGMIFFRRRGGEVEQVHSAYAQEAMDRRERSRERNSWKQGTTFNISAGGGMRNFEAADAPMQATSAVHDSNGDLLYFLRDEGMGGLFRMDFRSGREQRLALKQNLHLTHLNLSPDRSMLVAASMQSTGVGNIALMTSDGGGYREITSGDSVDASPAWIPGIPRQLLFQSSGFARDERGYIVAQGNAAILKLDMDSGSVTTILEDPRFDFLKPRVAPSGDLLFIRRPYEAPRYGTAAMLVDTLYFPFRLLRAVFHYLNFFSLMYSRKPLTSANGPATQADMKSILLQGKRVDAENALRSARAVNGVPSLVPDSWQLIARDQDGKERALASNVASYDIAADGTVIYSNGRGVFELGADGSSRIALTDQLVSEVAATQ